MLLLLAGLAEEIEFRFVVSFVRRDSGNTAGSSLKCVEASPNPEETSWSLSSANL